MLKLAHDWPVGLLASAYWPAHDPHRLTMAICVGYFEKAPSTAEPATVTVAGLVAPKARWRFFEDRWPRALRAENLSVFNGRDFARGTGEFGAGWTDDEPRRTRLLQSLTRVAEQHVLRGFSCSIHLDDYEAVNTRYRFAETASGPYGVCAACLTSQIQRWMAERYPEELTLVVFEEADLDHREIRRILSSEGVDRGEPVQVWPRQWTDERGRRRIIRPFEACDLLMPDCRSGLVERLSQREAWEHEQLDRHRLNRMCEALMVPARSATPSSLEGVA